MAKCDVFIAISDFPAIGLGYELGVAVEKLQKPTLALAHKDDIVLITGKGAEQSIIIGGKHFPWDDRIVVREELRKRLVSELSPPLPSSSKTHTPA